MPAYEYECDKCALRFEVTRGFKETGGGICPCCGSEARRVYLPPPLIFKGPGFYITDSRKSAEPSGEGQPAKPDSSKPAVKPEPGKTAARHDAGNKDGH